MSLRQRTLFIGAGAGAAAAGLAVGLTLWLGPVVGGVAGPVAATVVCGLAALAASFGLEERVRAQLVALDRADMDLSGPAPPGFGIDELDELMESVREALRRARHSAAETEEVGRMARSLWVSVNGKTAATPEPARCISGLIDLFHQTAGSLRRYAESLSEANERMAHGALDQTETVGRTTSTVEALSDKIDRISQNAENATDACARTLEEARRGIEQVHQVIEGIDRLHAQIELNGRKARRLGDRSVEIGTIVELIRGISSRTDMLALNATIESVRAGEHGRGFAVVAEEIRKLAERTAAATRDISTLVEAIQADTHESIRALAEEQTAMEQEAQRVRETGTALERISQMAEGSAQLVDGISKSSNDQVLAAQELVKAMQRISDVSHVTMERSNESREAIHGLAQWCDRLAPLAPEPAPDRPAEHPHEPPGGPTPSSRRRAPGSSVRILR